MTETKGAAEIKEVEGFKGLEAVRDLNFRVLRYYSEFLTRCPRIITKELMDAMTEGGEVTAQEAYAAIMGELCGLEPENNPQDRIIFREYFSKGIRRLDAEHYRNDPYLRRIEIPNTIKGRWEFRWEKYEPYEGFVCDEIQLKEDFKEIPRIGFFEETFSFPAVLEDGNEWMLITPNEIETMRPVIGEVSGSVLTFGLGLGYFAYMVSEKEQVEAVTVVERDPEVIELFRQYVLPQFDNGHKVKVVPCDAFDYAERVMPGQRFDYAFVDLWNDPSNGVERYLKMKRMERLNPHTKFRYWIERSLLSHLRWAAFEGVAEAAEGSVGGKEKPSSLEELKELLSDRGLKKLVKEIGA